MRARPALLCVTALIWIMVAVKLDATAACRSLALSLLHLSA